jgi:uncharacterized protein
LIASTNGLHPVLERNRIASLDVLRGVAVLGILIMNIQAFAMPKSAYLNPTSFGKLEGNDFFIWLLSHVFADQKFMTIFSMLFGASIIMLSQKAKRHQRRSTKLQYRRFLYLGILGLIHAYLIWSGDILFLYAITGALIYLFRSKKSHSQMRAGIVFLIIGSSISILSGFSTPFWEEPEYNNTITEVWMPTPEAQSNEIDQYKGSLSQQMAQRKTAALEFQTTVFAFESFWRIAGCMLIGMALFKRKVFIGRKNSTHYLKMIGYGIGIGLPLVIVGTILDFNYDWDFRLSFFFFSQLNYWGSIFMAIGYIGLIVLMCKPGTTSFIAKSMTHVGRMALSNYLMQSLICSFIFYGIGLGYFGSLDRPAQALLVLLIWIFQILFSNTWLRFFRYGPFEWLWRSLSYGKKQRMLKNA